MISSRLSRMVWTARTGEGGCGEVLHEFVSLERYLWLLMCLGPSGDMHAGFLATTGSFCSPVCGLHSTPPHLAVGAVSSLYMPQTRGTLHQKQSLSAELIAQPVVTCLAVSLCICRDDGREDSRTSTQSPSKRARSSIAITVDSDYEGGNDAGERILLCAACMVASWWNVYQLWKDIRHTWQIRAAV